jgi:hypothetical protein
MDLGAILILLVLLIAVGLFLAAPLMRGARPRPLDESPEVSALLAERDRVINALQELDFDFKLGKVPEDGYPAQRAELLRRGASILKDLDQLTPQPATGKNASERIEQAVVGGPGAAEPPGGELGDERIESLLAGRRAARRDKSAGFCPHCGKPVLFNDRFCPNCGKTLQ